MISKISQLNELFCLCDYEHISPYLRCEHPINNEFELTRTLAVPTTRVFEGSNAGVTSGTPIDSNICKVRLMLFTLQTFEWSSSGFYSPPILRYHILTIFNFRCRLKRLSIRISRNRPPKFTERRKSWSFRARTSQLTVIGLHSYVTNYLMVSPSYRVSVSPAGT